jgi:chromosome segregation ATPase
MSEVPAEANSPITLVRSLVIDFMNNMLQEKSVIEQQIKEKSEEIRTQFTQMGQSTFNFSDVDNLAKSYKDFYSNYYKNTVHLRVVAAAARKIREGIHQGLINADVIREEVLTEFRELQKIASEKGEMDLRSSGLEEELLHQTESYSDLQSENMRLQNELRQARGELAEKSAEFENLNASIMQMENQLNMVAQQMIDSKNEVEDLQTALAERDNEIAMLKSETKGKSALLTEIESYKQTIKDMTKRENELLASQSSTSDELFDQLQAELEKTRNELYKIKAERVERNEEVRKLKLELEETLINMSSLSNYKETAEETIKSSKEQADRYKTQKEEFETKYNHFKDQFTKKELDLNEIQSKYEEAKTKLEVAEANLKTFEGKVSLSEEAKEGYEKSLKYFTQILNYDPKFRTLSVLDSFGTEMQLEDLAKSLSLPGEIVHKCLVELVDVGFINLRRDGNLTFAKSDDTKRSPIALSEIFSEK